MCIVYLNKECVWAVHILGHQLRMSCAIELTQGSEDWNAQPLRIYSIKNINISKASNKRMKRSFDDENALHKFEGVQSIDQTFQVQAVIRKCKVV